MTPADRCDRCALGCRSIQACRARCGALEAEAGIAAKPPRSPRRRRLENTATVAAILTLAGVPALSLWLAGAFAS